MRLAELLERVPRDVGCRIEVYVDQPKSCKPDRALYVYVIRARSGLRDSGRLLRGSIGIRLFILPPNRGSLPEVIRRENPPPPTKGYLWYPPPALNGAEAGGAPRAPPRESC